MVKIKCIIISVCSVILSGYITKADTGQFPADQIKKQSAPRNLSSQPLAFTENQGQWDKRVRFRANAGGATMWFSSDGAYYQFTRTIKSEDSDLIPVANKQYGMLDDMMDRQPKAFETMMIKANFVGANDNAVIIGLEEMEYKCNYFIGNDPNEWYTDVRNYSAVMYEEIYDGIDLKYYGNGKQMEYDFIVSPGADFSQIRIQYEGAESIAINSNGELVITTKWGEIVEQRPVIYQVESSRRISIASNYKIQGKNTFGFELSDHNPDLPLVIDPVLTYSTYLGGSSYDICYGIAVDVSGAAYVTGYTRSTNFPLLNPFQGTYQGGFSDIFVTKLSSSGNSFVYSTYIGGSTSTDGGYDIAVDDSGAAYITGFTSSTDFPTVNPFQGELKHGAWDAFVTKLSSTGNTLVYSTFLGGNADEFGNAIAVDSSGSAYITGFTNSTNFPIFNAYQETHQISDSLDVFVTKLSSSGNSLIYSTFLGGTHNDEGRGIAVDELGAAYITGNTFSNDFPTLNPFQGMKQDSSDAFVTKLSSSGNSLVYSTYLGGDMDDFGRGIAVDATGAAFITGHTFSTDFPILNPYQGTFQGGLTDAFVTKLSSSGNSMIYSTYLGGSSTDVCYDIAIDAIGAAYVTGVTNSSTFPTLDPYQDTIQGVDAFVTNLSGSGNSLLYSTFLGGSETDIAYSIAVDDSGAMYMAGLTSSINFPTLNPNQETFQGGSADVFVTKFDGFEISCCVGATGNVDGDGGVDISDLTFLIDHLFINFPDIACPEEGNVDGDGGTDISDLTFLIDHLFINFPDLPDCP